MPKTLTTSTKLTDNFHLRSILTDNQPKICPPENAPFAYTEKRKNEHFFCSMLILIRSLSDSIYKTLDQTVIGRVERDLRPLVELFALSDCVKRIQDSDTIASFATIACSGNGKCGHCVCVCGLIRRKIIQ